VFCKDTSLFSWQNEYRLVFNQNEPTEGHSIFNMDMSNIAFSVKTSTLFDYPKLSESLSKYIPEIDWGLFSPTEKNVPVSEQLLPFLLIEFNQLHKHLLSEELKEELELQRTAISHFQKAKDSNDNDYCQGVRCLYEYYKQCKTKTPSDDYERTAVRLFEICLDAFEAYHDINDVENALFYACEASYYYHRMEIYKKSKHPMLHKDIEKKMCDVMKYIFVDHKDHKKCMNGEFDFVKTRMFFFTQKCSLE